MLRSIAAAVSFAAGALLAGGALAQGKEIKIGVIYDLTGPFAAGGSNASYLGTKYAIDMINEKGGVEGYKIKPIYADAQSKADVAINEAERLLNQEKVDLIMGVFSSAHCVPMAPEGRPGQEIHVGQRLHCLRGAQGQEPEVRVPAAGALRPVRRGLVRLPERASKDKLGKEPKDLTVAIIYEDGPYGVGVAKGNEAGCKKARHQVVLKEGYAATAPDLSRAGHQAASAPARRDLAHRLQPGHHAVPAPGQEQGLKFGA